MSSRKKVCFVVVGFIAMANWIPTASATVLTQSEVADRGTYDGAYFKLADTGFGLTGDPLAQTVYLQSVTFKRDYPDSQVPPSTQGDLYLKVFTGATGGLGTFTGVSSNTVNVYNITTDGALLTWTFNSLALDKDTTYSYVVGVSNDSSNPDALFRFKLSGNTTPLPSCAELQYDAPKDVGYAPWLEITTSNIPEPSALVLSVMGGISLLAYAWRRRR